MTPRKPYNPKKTIGHFILIGKLAVPEPDLFKWCEWFEKSARDDSRRVAKTQVGGVSISTVFLGLDHGFDFSGKAIPILFETMAFGGTSRDIDCERCETWEQAEQQHADMVAKFRAAIKDKVND